MSEGMWGRAHLKSVSWVRDGGMHGSGAALGWRKDVEVGEGR